MTQSVDMYLLEGCGRCPLGGTPNCKVHSWIEELRELRQIILECGLTEESKWGVACYTHSGKNVLLLSAFKDYCSISFFKGALLRHDLGLLEKPGPNSHAGRLIKIRSMQDIQENGAEIKACIFEAIEVEKAGLTVPARTNSESIPEELELKFEEDPMLKTAFEALTPGRQRGYLLFFSAPKQSKTRLSRIDKSIEKILNGEGLHDTYNRRK